MKNDNVPVKEVQAELIKIFERWGKPKGAQVDNCLPFVTPPRGIPTPLLIWLIGMDIKVQQIRPYQLTDNTKVERMQDVTYRWPESFNRHSIKQLKKALQEVCFIRCE